MPPFNTLSQRAQALRLRQVAINALRQYDLHLRDVHLLGQYTNTLFRARTVEGVSYLVRVCKPGWRTDDDLRSEGMWLQALRQERGAAQEAAIGAPAPVFARSGAFVVEATAAGVPEPRRCTVTGWLPGVSLEKRLTDENLVKMGALFARLHEFALGFQPPAGFTTRKMDSIYARGEADVLFSEAYYPAFTPSSRGVYERTRRVVEDAYARLFEEPGLRVIHNDLWHGNMHLYRGRLHPLDFEDTLWGYPVHDIAMALQDLMRALPAADFKRLRACFQAGYESLCPWPETAPAQIDTFRAGRMLWVTNYVALHEQEYLANHIQWNARVFEHFLDAGEISLEYA